MTLENTNKVAIITGGARRIGRTVALELHKENIDIVLHYRNSAQDAAELANELNASRENSCVLVQGELNDETVLEKIITTAIEHFGRLDILVNNASSFYPTPIEKITDGQWNDLFASNLKAPAFLCKYATPELRKNNGCIVNIIDVYANRPLANHPIYCAAKAGLQSLTKSLAADLAPDIRVNGVSPGAILWPEDDSGVAPQEVLLKRIPMNRLGDPNDIAQTIVFLSCKAPYITGQIIAVDGGKSAKA